MCFLIGGKGVEDCRCVFGYVNFSGGEQDKSEPVEILFVSLFYAGADKFRNDRSQGINFVYCGGEYKQPVSDIYLIGPKVFLTNSVIALFSVILYQPEIILLYF